MNTTPKSNRLHIAIFGRANVGKSSFLNLLAGQDVAITSEHPGTTTDVVEKPMELLPLGPVVFLDTAGLDDTSALGAKRVAKTNKVFERADVCVLILEADKWTDYEAAVLAQANTRKIPLLAVVNKIDLLIPSKEFFANFDFKIILCNSLDKSSRNKILDDFKTTVLTVIPENLIHQPGLLDGLINPGEIAVLVVPIDLEAPKGRLILPQVQAIRDVLDSDAAAVVVKERELSSILENIKAKPAIVICDSQAVLKVSADIPTDVKFTTFSILFSRAKGDLVEMAKGAAQISKLKPTDKILIAEACTHHAIGDDIARVKIPRWLTQYLGFKPAIDIFAGKDYPLNLSEYSLIIHCGACMFNRRQMLSRIDEAKEKKIPITNYGMAISLLQGVIDRALSPFPGALSAYKKALA